MKRAYIAIAVTVLVSGLLWGTTGFKYLENYTTGDFEQYPQNWTILQDKRGVVYSANNYGLLEFDGANWRLLLIPGYPNIRVRSIALDEDGTLYAGGQDEIGFFTMGPVGPQKYTSLTDRLTNTQKRFYKVWQIKIVPDGVFFRTTHFLFRWRPRTQELNVWETNKKNPFGKSFACGGTLFIRVGKTGLKKVSGDRLELVPGGGFFKDKAIYMIVPYGKGEIFLIGTRGSGFYLYDGVSTIPFPIESWDYIKRKKLSNGLRLSNRDIALATLEGGLVIIDEKGKTKHIFDKTSGLQDVCVRHIYEGFSGNLWLALNDGVGKIEYGSPFSFYDERLNLEGQVLTVVWHDDTLYAGTNYGLYNLAPDGRFHPIEGVPRNCFSLCPTGGVLMAATGRGVYAVANNKIRQWILNVPSYRLLQSKKDPNRIWVGTDRGLISIYQDGKRRQWEKEHTFKRYNRKIETIVEDSNGNLWLGLSSGGVLRVDVVCGSTGRNPEIEPYNADHGLPGGEIKVFKAAGHVMFTSQAEGIYRFHEKEKRFVPDASLGEMFAGGGKGVFYIAEGRDNHIWLHSRGRNYELTPIPGGGFKIDPTPLLRIPQGQVNAIYPGPGGNVVWIAGNKGITRYEWQNTKNYRQGFSTLIREVVINGARQFYNGGSRSYETGGSNTPPEIQFKDRNLQFRVAAAFFEGTSRTRFRYFLEGYDDDWSDWTNKAWKDYTNLGAGDYTFRAQARNVYMHLGKEAAYRFKVLPPWYQTWWALTLYALLAFLGLYLVVRWRSGKLEKEKQKLEQVVEERTREIHQKTRQLETQTLQLKDQAQKLQEMAEVKSRFFANISHEFRTPLTLIMGPLEQILHDYRDKDGSLTKKARLMLRNSQRLFTLINRLLDLSKLDSGKMQLHAVRQNIVPFLKGMVASFDMMANQNDLDLTFQAGEEDITLYFDTEKLEDVLCNLLVNAVKFTPAGGLVTVAVKQVAKQEKHFPSGHLEISVSDTGPGIPREQLANIFDRFYQSDSTYEQHRQGFGIGLALTRELINLHHGRIDVHSREGDQSGTQFIIRLPLGKELYEPKEISVLPEPHREHRGTAQIQAAAVLGQDDADTGDDAPQTGIDPLKTGKNIILVVDDNSDIRQYIRGALEPDYTVSEAAGGQEGVDLAQSLIPDLIISDIMMPEVDGCQLCDTLKKDIKTSHIPIILLTAKASEKDIIHGLESGADDYITKPFSTRMLAVRIKNLIDLRRHFQLTLYREMTRQPAKMAVSRIDREFIKELQDMIEKNLADPDFNVEQLGKKLYMSRATLYRKIHALSGESPNEFIQSYRLKQAAELLEKKFGTVLEVAFETGFSSASYFTKCFKKKFNCLPSEYQETHGAG